MGSQNLPHSQDKKKVDTNRHGAEFHLQYSMFAWPTMLTKIFYFPENPEFGVASSSGEMNLRTFVAQTQRSKKSSRWDLLFKLSNKIPQNAFTLANK